MWSGVDGYVCSSMTFTMTFLNYFMTPNDPEYDSCDAPLCLIFCSDLSRDCNILGIYVQSPYNYDTVISHRKTAQEI